MGSRAKVLLSNGKRIGLLLLPLILCTLAALDQVAALTYEDFSTFIEYDPNTHIGIVGTNHVDHYALRNEDAWLYKDQGIDNFTDFEHRVDVWSDFDQSGSSGIVWALSNEIDDFNGLRTTDKDAICVLFVRCATYPYFQLKINEVTGGNYYEDYVGITDNAWYYLIIEKTDKAFTCEGYITPERITPLFTLSLTLHSDYAFRYVFACNTWNSGTAEFQTNQIENLWLGIEPPPVVLWHWQVRVIFFWFGLALVFVPIALIAGRYIRGGNIISAMVVILVGFAFLIASGSEMVGEE